MMEISILCIARMFMFDGCDNICISDYNLRKDVHDRLLLVDWVAMILDAPLTTMSWCQLFDVLGTKTVLGELKFEVRFMRRESVTTSNY